MLLLMFFPKDGAAQTKPVGSHIQTLDNIGWVWIQVLHISKTILVLNLYVLPSYMITLKQLIPAGPNLITSLIDINHSAKLQKRRHSVSVFLIF